MCCGAHEQVTLPCAAHMEWRPRCGKKRGAVGTMSPLRTEARPASADAFRRGTSRGWRWYLGGHRQTQARHVLWRPSRFVCNASRGGSRGFLCVPWLPPRLDQRWRCDGPLQGLCAKASSTRACWCGLRALVYLGVFVYMCLLLHIAMLRSFIAPFRHA